MRDITDICLDGMEAFPPQEHPEMYNLLFCLRCTFLQEDSPVLTPKEEEDMRERIITAIDEQDVDALRGILRVMLNMEVAP